MSPYRDASGSEELIRESLHAYLVGELGWGEEEFENRLALELDRQIPKALFDQLEGAAGWEIQGHRLLDVGAGQGAAVEEALRRGADAWGIEPSGGFGYVARVRLLEAGFAPGRIIPAGGERLPVPDETFDFIVCLQTLEHVDDPRAVLREVERVLRPGGRCWVTCENYLAFREQHYRLAWLPLLPKTLGALYLRARGRNPGFLRQHVTYVTYPGILSAVRESGLTNLTRQRVLWKAEDTARIERRWLRWLARTVPVKGVVTRRLAAVFDSIRNLFRVGITAELQKVET